jgi:hypothetical protein
MRHSWRSEGIMFIKQSELFWDLGHGFVKELVEKSEK